MLNDLIEGLLIFFAIVGLAIVLEILFPTKQRKKIGWGKNPGNWIYDDADDDESGDCQ